MIGIWFWMIFTILDALESQGKFFYSKNIFYSKKIWSHFPQIKNSLLYHYFCAAFMSSSYILY